MNFRLALVGLLCAAVSCLEPESLRWLMQQVASETKNKFNDDQKYDCTTSEGKNGFCVKKAQCDTPTQNVIDPTTVFTYRGKECHFLEECCEKSKVITKTPPGPYKPPALCGISNPGALSFRETTDQNFSDFADFPWMVAILKTGKTDWDNEDYIGGGSIISPSVVITAAHKIDDYNPGQIKCRAGEWDTQVTKEVLPHQDRLVKKIVLHPEFLKLHAHNDVALLILSEPFTLAPHVGVACLGRIMPPAGTECYSMGWGADIKKKTSYSGILKKILLKLVRDKQCEINLKNTELGSTYTLHNSLTCAGGEGGVDTCVGDGGSPLVCPLPDPSRKSTRYAVYGMVAYGVGCGEKDVPGVYVNIPQVYQWVKDQMVAERLPNTQFDYCSQQNE
ncbi:phenoloxidase-activating factor 2-like [Aricia agestis]|uniref:phenoloxidase-activating factor 2-like n=1 Tax=Aricia agestis TaxID=91739 RepID=UPI001C202D9C|nr:phenoloxidase-activating factor 2-like [Aricia agestis]